MSRFARQVEKRIKSKIKDIKNGKTEVKGSGVNNLIKRLKDFDEAAAEELQKDYIEAVKIVNKNKKD